MAGVEPHVLRFWETEFPGLRPKKDSGGQRIYVRREIELIRRIRRMLYEEGYTIDGARRRLNRPGGGPTGQVLRLIRRELEAVMQSLEELEGTPDRKS